jgi:hypothetical protein
MTARRNHSPLRLLLLVLTIASILPPVLHCAPVESPVESHFAAEHMWDRPL